MSYETVLLDKSGYVTKLTLNRPPHNAVSYTMLQELDVILDELSADRDVRVVVITGSGDRSFCAGMDVGDAMAHPDVGDVGRALWTRVDMLDKPTIAAINGHALGGGCELAFACHFRFMADNPKAVIGCPEVNLGITPGWGGTQRMTRLLGRSKALDLMLNARRLSPQEALQMGLVDKVIAPGEFLDKVMEYATALSQKAPLSVQAIIKSSTTFLYQGIETGLKVEGATSKVCVASKDSAEGFAAFMEKRAPVFRGE